MTPTDEARFIELWTEGASYQAIAQAMHLKAGTAGSRAKRLADEGKIQPRPRGGAYPKQKALAQGEGVDGVPQQTPRVSHRVSKSVF